MAREGVRKYAWEEMGDGQMGWTGKGRTRERQRETEGDKKRVGERE